VLPSCRGIACCLQPHRTASTLKRRGIRHRLGFLTTIGCSYPLPLLLFRICNELSSSWTCRKRW
jgi:hypothetical protein